MRRHPIARAATLATVAAVTTAAWACGADLTAVGPNLPALAGGYALRTVDGDTLPATVATALDQGRVTGGGLCVDGRDLEYRLTFTVLQSNGGFVQYTSRGYVQAHPRTPFDSAVFVNTNGTALFTTGALKGDTLASPALRGLRVQFRRVGPCGPAG